MPCYIRHFFFHSTFKQIHTRKLTHSTQRTYVRTSIHITSLSLSLFTHKNTQCFWPSRKKNVHIFLLTAFLLHNFFPVWCANTFLCMLVNICFYYLGGKQAIEIWSTSNWSKINACISMNVRKVDLGKNKKIEAEASKTQVERVSVITNRNSNVVTMREFRRILIYVERMWVLRRDGFSVGRIACGAMWTQMEKFKDVGLESRVR